MGSAVKRWLVPPEQSPWADFAPAWLFKEVRAKWVHGQRRVFGEDWSEKVVAELARVLGVPTAQVELAISGATRGVVSPTFVRPREQSFIPGNELLAGHDPSYPVAETGQVPGYTLDAVRAVLEPYRPPEALLPDLEDGFSAFTGYLVLDALVANTDRHHENWGVIETLGKPARLAPSYDHGTSLGFQEPDDHKGALLGDPRLSGAGPARVAVAISKADQASLNSPLRPWNVFPVRPQPTGSRAWKPSILARGRVSSIVSRTGGCHR